MTLLALVPGAAPSLSDVTLADAITVCRLPALVHVIHSTETEENTLHCAAMGVRWLPTYGNPNRVFLSLCNLFNNRFTITIYH